jgi:hypothetical protein
MAEAKEKPKADEAVKSPSSGIFGFAGPTLFQPGQSQFDPAKAAVPFKPEAKDADVPDHA